MYRAKQQNKTSTGQANKKSRSKKKNENLLDEVKQQLDGGKE